MTSYVLHINKTGGAGGSFPSLTGLLGRWRADAGVTTSSGNVTQVLDQSGNGNTLVSSGVVPFNATGFNGKPTFDFIAANGGALFRDPFPMGTGQRLSVFMIGQLKSATPNYGGCAGYGVFAQNDYNDPGSFAFGRDSASDGLIVTNNSVSADLAMTANVNHRFGFTLDMNSGGLQSIVYVDNSPGAPATVGVANLNDGGTLVIGGRWLAGAISSASNWEGPISEIVVCNALLSTTERNNLDSYLSTHWLSS